MRVFHPHHLTDFASLDRVRRVSCILALVFSFLCLSARGNEPEVGVAPKITTLDSLVVSGKNYRYSKKNNPAYELMKHIRESKQLGDPKDLPEYSRNFHTKMVLGLNDCDASAFKGKDKFLFLQEYVDTAAHSGLPVLLISLKEKIGTGVHSQGQSGEHLIVRGRRSAGIDDQLNNENITTMLEDIFRNVDIYKDDIAILNQRFVSPISGIADNFYRYFLNDTIVMAGRKYLELVFAPRTPETFGFNGRMFVEADDSTYFIKRVEMRVPRLINLNYVDNIYITQEYEKDNFGKRHISLDDMVMEIKIIPGTQPFYGRRVSKYSMPEMPAGDGLRKFLDEASGLIVYEDADSMPMDIWETSRLIPLSGAESSMGSLMSRLRKFPLIYWGEKILKILVQGYISTGKKSKFDFGPVNTLISYNSMEGVRLRLGGMTTANLSPHWFARGYVAYGFKDKKIKYNAEIEYSLLRKKYHSREFPVNSLRAEYSYELDQIGQHYIYTNADNIFLSLKRKSSELALYRRLAGLTYQLELRNNLSVEAGFSHRIYESTPNLPFATTSGLRYSSYTLAGFRLRLRYAPGEKYMQAATYRYPINKDAPIFIISQEIVPRGMLGSRFTLNKTEVSFSKRFWFSAFGYLDCIIKGGKIWSKVDYPQLLWQNANLSYTIQPESYSLLNPMEFPMDYYGSIDLNYYANGLILNRIPLIKKLKLREVVGFKGLMGGLTSKNNPEHNEGLMMFPPGVATGRLSAKPYMELNAGLDNILTFLRLDFVWRLTYRNLPEASRWGVRVSAHFSF